MSNWKIAYLGAKISSIKIYLAPVEISTRIKWLDPLAME